MEHNRRITDGDLADQLHPLDILFMKNHYEKEKGNNRFMRRAPRSITKAGIKLFERIAFVDFNLCINYDCVHQKKVHLPPLDTSIPLELKDHTRTRDIFELSKINVSIEEKDDQPDHKLKMQSRSITKKVST
ncbi:hypothetical protein Hanom_Chr01g00068551 [Helianthus anomalus]